MFKKTIKGLKDVWCGSLEFDTTPKAGSYNPVTSDGIYKAIQGSVIPANVDVIKWSDVQEVQDSDYSEFIDRIADDIEAGIAPVLLDAVNDNGVVVLYEFSDSVAAFRTSPDINGRYYSYVIRSDSAIIQHPQITIPMRNGGTMSIDTGLVYVKNNTVADYTYDGNNPLDFVFSGDANFEVTIKSTAAADGTVNVYKQNNGLLTPIMQSVAGGNTVEAGKTYQLTCSNDGWTLAEYEASNANYKLVLGTSTNRQSYDAVKIGTRIWMAANLCLTWEGLMIGGNPTAEESNAPWAWYYKNDARTYGNGPTGAKWGLLYNKAAIDYLVEHPELLEGWRVPTENDIGLLQTAAGGNTAAGSAAVRKVSAWTNETETATDSTGFSAVPSCHAIWSAEGVTFDATGTEIAIIHTSGSVDPDTNSSRVMTISDTSPTYLTGTDGHKYNGYSLRLCRDAEA